MWMQTLRFSRAVLQNLDILWCRLSRATIVSLQSKQNKIYFGSQLDVSLKRDVHYKPNVNKEMDRKQEIVIKNFEITLEDCEKNPKIWCIHPHTLEHRGLVLLEGGFQNVTASFIVNYFRIVKKPVWLLKLHGYINSETSVIESYFRNLENIPLDKLNMKHCKEDKNTLVDTYNTILKSYLMWRLEISSSGIDRILKTYPRIKHKSMKYISWSLNILEHDLQFSKDKIRRNGYLIHSYPHNTLDTLRRVPVLGGKDIKEVFHRHPKVIMTNTDNLLSIVQLMKDYNIPDTAVQRCYEVFTLGSASMQQRLHLLHSVPELRPFATNPRVLHIVHYQRKVSERVAYLQSIKRQVAPLHVLTSSQAHFDRFTNDDLNRYRGNDIAKLLATEFDTQDTIIRSSLKRHPFWHSISSVSVQTTLDYLLEKKFDKATILSNLQLVLYPSCQVKKILEGLSTFEAVKDAQNIFRMTNPYKEPILTKETELALCLYFLEKEHHFTGNGIWITS